MRLSAFSENVQENLFRLSEVWFLGNINKRISDQRLLLALYISVVCAVWRLFNLGPLSKQHLAMSKLEGESTSGNKESVGEENAADGQEVEGTALLNLEKTTENVIYAPISSLEIGAIK